MIFRCLQSFCLRDWHNVFAEHSIYASYSLKEGTYPQSYLFACLAVTFSVSFSPPPPITIGGWGFWMGFGSQIASATL